MSDTAQRSTWELSPAFEQSNAELRSSVVRALDNYCTPGEQWPARAAIIEVLTPTMKPSAMYNYVACGQYGIHRTIERDELPNVVTWSSDDTSVDCWFLPAISGNTDGMKPAEWELWAYLITPTDLVVIHLGCDHADRYPVKESGNYTRMTCPTCQYTYGVTNA